eukprot:COSAG01_NODE_8868_length_2631_cov_27.022907_1_plen_47_part_00
MSPPTILGHALPQVILPPGGWLALAGLLQVAPSSVEVVSNTPCPVL